MVRLTCPGVNLHPGDVVSRLRELKAQEGPDLLVFGSGGLVQTLLKHQLIDILYTWIFRFTLGPGKRLFQDGTQALEWHLMSTTVSTTGAIIAGFEPKGPVKLGPFEPDHPSEAELERRERVARGEW